MLWGKGYGLDGADARHELRPPVKAQERPSTSSSSAKVTAAEGAAKSSPVPARPAQPKAVALGTASGAAATIAAGAMAIAGVSKTPKAQTAVTVKETAASSSGTTDGERAQSRIESFSSLMLANFP